MINKDEALFGVIPPFRKVNVAPAGGKHHEKIIKIAYEIYSYKGQPYEEFLNNLKKMYETDSLSTLSMIVHYLMDKDESWSNMNNLHSQMILQEKKLREKMIDKQSDVLNQENKK